MNKVVLAVGTVVTVLVCLLLGLLLSSKTDREPEPEPVTTTEPESEPVTTTEPESEPVNTTEPESEPSQTGKKLENDEMCGITTGGQASFVCREGSEI